MHVADDRLEWENPHAKFAERLMVWETKMSNLAWRDAYAGESTEKLIALEKTYRIDSLVLVFAQALDQKIARSGAQALTKEEQIVLAVEALEREVNNGGYQQFFLNYSHQHTPVIVEALERIGCHEAARLTERAINIIGLDPVTEFHKYPEVVAALADEQIATLQLCSNDYFAKVGDLSGPLFEFIRTERTRIALT